MGIYDRLKRKIFHTETKYDEWSNELLDKLESGDISAWDHLATYLELGYVEVDKVAYSLAMGLSKYILENGSKHSSELSYETENKLKESEYTLRYLETFDPDYDTLKFNGITITRY